VLNGGVGNDSLTGSAGADTFVFDAGPFNGVDTLVDFASGVDVIVLVEGPTSNIFPIDPDGPGTVLPDEFLSGAGKTAPETPDHHIIYNTTTGALYYDRDGTGFSYSTVQIATLSGNPLLVATDIHAG
jgi:Ca2+-binding RTX toxin-like protein